MELDDIDLALLAQLQMDALVPARVLGDAVGLSTAAAQRRINRLRASGVLVETSAVVSPAAVGLDVSCVVEVRLERDGADVVDRLRQRFVDEPSVQQCYYVTGGADFVLIVLCEDFVAYEALTKTLFLDDPDVRSFTTMVVLDAVTTTRRVPLDPEHRHRHE